MPETIPQPVTKTLNDLTFVSVDLDGDRFVAAATFPAVSAEGSSVEDALSNLWTQMISSGGVILLDTRIRYSASVPEDAKLPRGRQWESFGDFQMTADEPCIGYPYPIQVYWGDYPSEGFYAGVGGGEAGWHGMGRGDDPSEAIRNLWFAIVSVPGYILLDLTPTYMQSALDKMGESGGGDIDETPEAAGDNPV